MTDDKALIHIVDDDDDIRNAIGSILENEGYSVQKYCDAEDYLSRDIELKHGCIILDMQMSDKSGLELQKDLLKQDNPLPILFLTGTGTISTAVTAMKKGAVEFLTKPVSVPDLLKAVTKAVALSVTTVDHSRFMQTLTVREQDVFLLMEAGNLNKVIATELGISEKTVEYHKRNIRKKSPT